MMPIRDQDLIFSVVNEFRQSSEEWRNIGPYRPLPVLSIGRSLPGSRRAMQWLR